MKEELTGIKQNLHAGLPCNPAVRSGIKTMTLILMLWFGQKYEIFSYQVEVLHLTSWAAECLWRPKLSTCHQLSSLKLIIRSDCQSQVKMLNNKKKNFNVFQTRRAIFLSFRNPFGSSIHFSRWFRRWVVSLFWVNFTHSLKWKSKTSVSQTFHVILNEQFQKTLQFMGLCEKRLELFKGFYKVDFNFMKLLLI